MKEYTTESNPKKEDNTYTCGFHIIAAIANMEMVSLAEKIKRIKAIVTVVEDIQNEQTLI